MDPLHDAMRHGCCTELDRLREENARLKAERDAALTHGPEDMVRALEELTRELDEARAEVRRLRAIISPGDAAAFEEYMAAREVHWVAEVARLSDKCAADAASAAAEILRLRADLEQTIGERDREVAEVARLEGLILDWGAEIGRPEGPAWAKLEAEARRIRAQREEER